MNNIKSNIKYDHQILRLVFGTCTGFFNFNFQFSNLYGFRAYL